MGDGRLTRRAARRRMRRWAIILAVNALLIALGVLVLELLFGNWFNPNRMGRLNIMRDAEQRFEVRHLYPSEEPYALYRRDHYGFRGSYPAPDRIDVLTIGGSTTDQRYIGEGMTWQDVLAREFERAGKRISVVNAGVDGQSTYGHIKDFDWWFPFVPGLSVRYYLFYVGLNDFYKGEGYYADALVRNDHSIMSSIRDNSVLYHLYRMLRGIYEARYVLQVSHRSIDYSKATWVETGRVSAYEALLAGHLSAYKQRLEMLAEKAKAAGGEAIFVTQPSRRYRLDEGGKVEGVADVIRAGTAEINGVDFYHMIRLMDRAVQDVGKEKGAVALDAAGEVRWEDGDFYDYVHFTPRGAEKLGRYLHEKLAGVVEEATGGGR